MTPAGSAPDPAAFTQIAFEVADGVATVTLDRPEGVTAVLETRVPSWGGGRPDDLPERYPWWTDPGLE